MSALDRLIATPRLCETDAVELAAPPARVWELVRHGELSRSRIVDALFALRTLPSRIGRRGEREMRLQIDDLVSTPEQPGFQVLIDEPPHTIAVGAIGRVFQPDIPFVHVADAAAFAAFAEPGEVRVAWSLTVSPLGSSGSRLELELRVDATDEASWDKFKRYFRLIGPGSRFVRHALLRGIERELGAAAEDEERRTLPGDELLPDADEQITHAITIHASPDRVWPWLVQLGARRGGFYSVDLLDNGGSRSAREIHPELQALRVGEVIPATPDSADGFEVLRIEPPQALVLGGLYDLAGDRQLRFGDGRPARYWHVTWAFVLEPAGPDATRLHVRARAAFSTTGFLRAAWMRPAHHLMERAQLRGLKARVEGTLPRDDFRDVVEGISGASMIALSMLSPFRRGARNHWGLSAEEAARSLPGDELVAAPRWAWTHGVEIDAKAEDVWPWIAQIGATRGGFYSYQWLENVVGCELRNAEVVHPEWEARVGDELHLHPKQPPMHVVAVERGRYVVAHAPADGAAKAAGKPWSEASWLFLLEPLEGGRCRFVSRFRSACSDDLATRLMMGPALLEPVGFAMDRRMLLGVKERAERLALRSRSLG